MKYIFFVGACTKSRCAQAIITSSHRPIEVGPVDLLLGLALHHEKLAFLTCIVDYAQ